VDSEEVLLDTTDLDLHGSKMIIFKSILTNFDVRSLMWKTGGAVAKNWLELKIKPP
jgi:hypothetical protein